MKYRILIIIAFSSINSLFSWDSEYSNIISEYLKDSKLAISMSRMAKSNGYKKSEKFNDGKPTKIVVRGPLPQIETLVAFKLSKLIILEELLKEAEKNNENRKFTLPIFVDVMSQSDINK